MISFQHTTAYAALELRKGVLHGRRILIADDSAPIRFVAATALRSLGATVKEASDGAQAIAFALADSFDLILMDVQMPVTDGHEATQKLRRAGLKDLPILALTGCGAKDLDICLASGMTDVLQKPFTQPLLIGRIMSMLGCTDAEIAATQQAKPAQSLFNTDSLHTLCGGDTALMQRMLGIAVQELPFAAQQMRVSYINGYLDQIAKLAHRVRPCAEGLGIAGLPDKLHRIEALAAAGDPDMAQLGALLLAVADEMERVARLIIAAG